MMAHFCFCNFVQPEKNPNSIMEIDVDKYQEIKKELGKKVTLIAVSKTKSVEAIRALYELGHRDFGENYVQELIQKQMLLPHDIRWHFIGHLQRNKVKYITPFVHMIHGVESYKLLEEINREAIKHQRTINCLLQVHIAQEESKFGLNQLELMTVIQDLKKLELLNQFNQVKICGLMGMASFTDDEEQIRKEFKYLKCLFDDAKETLKRPSFRTLSMGMSADYKIAIEEGSNMVRIGSLLFGARTYH